MPSAPKRPCRWPGCPALTTARFCESHRKDDRRAVDQRRGTAAQRGYGHRWQKYRKQFIAEHPLCEECRKNGRVAATFAVDHIVPHKGDEALFWAPTNHQGLCETCHNIKTATEDGGFGRI
jgi:5-methylcytosine-specific restriction protein A